jgi:DNA repair exonuclease SbcCD ATPase subunit
MAEPKKKPNGETPTMPENKKKTNGETPAPVTSNGSKFAAKFNKLINVCTDLKNDSEGAVDYGKTLEENTAVKAALKKSDDEVIRLNTEIQKLEQLKDHYLDDFSKKCGEFDTKLKDADSTKKTLNTTQEKLDEANEKMKQRDSENKHLEKKVQNSDALRKKDAQDFLRKSSRFKSCNSS